MTSPTRLSVLALVALATGILAYAVIDLVYAEIPTLPVYALVWLVVLAVVETYVAVMTRARLSGRHGTRPIDPFAVARLVALAKATSLVGAVALGFYGGFLVYVSRQSSAAAGQDSRMAGFGVGFSVVLVIAAWFLERVCRVPKDDDG